MAQQELDPITLQVISGPPDTIAEEMGHIRYRMSFSPIIRESQDLGAGLFDTDFNTLCESESTPLHIGSLPGYLAGIQETHHGGEWNDGDYELGDDVMPGVGRFRGRLGGVKKQRILTDGFIAHECGRHEVARRRLELQTSAAATTTEAESRPRGNFSRIALACSAPAPRTATGVCRSECISRSCRRSCAEKMRGAGFPFRRSSRNMPTGVTHDPRDSVFGVHPFEVCLGNTGHDVCKGPCKSPTGPTWRPTRSS